MFNVSINCGLQRLYNLAVKWMDSNLGFDICVIGKN